MPPPSAPRNTRDAAAGAAPGNEGPALSPLNPYGMHRAEDDARAAATSPDFNERPSTRDGHTAPAATIVTPSQRQHRRDADEPG